MRQLLSNLSHNFKINLDYTINSGQVFLWKKIKKKWYGINGNDILVLENTKKLKENMKNVDYFFRLDDDFEKIAYELKKDIFVRNALEMFPGLRLVRQDPFQCYISFIVSSNSNIPNIKSRLENLCKMFGMKKIVDGEEFFLFPDPSELANASITDIKKCGLGYRAKAVKSASLSVLNGEIDFDFLKKLDYHTAKIELLKVFGIGNKVADCILLFSLEKLEAFPLDRWMLRILQKYYSKEFQFPTKTITEKTYEKLHESVVEHFGSYAGYAQQFLFKMEREVNKKKWL